MKGGKHVPRDPEQLRAGGGQQSRVGSAKPENQAERTMSQRVCILSRSDGQPLEGSELGSDVLSLVFCRDRPLPAMWRHLEEGRGDGEPVQVSATTAMGQIGLTAWRAH